MDYHFEDDDVLNAIVGTDYLKETVRYRLTGMTSGAKWSLYRAIVAIALRRDMESAAKVVDELAENEMSETAELAYKTAAQAIRNAAERK